MKNSGCFKKRIFGRTMEEMLGVLVIMAALSLVAVGSIRIWFEQNEANKVTKEVVAQAEDIMTRRVKVDKADAKKVIYAYGDSLTEKYAYTRRLNDDNNKIVITANNIRKGVCEKMLTQDKGMFEDVYLVGASECAEEGNSVSFLLPMIGTPTCGGCEKFENGQCVNAVGDCEVCENDTIKPKTDTQACCERAGLVWQNGSCVSSVPVTCDACEDKKASGECVYNPNKSKNCCEKTDGYVWGGSTCCQSATQSAACCSAAKGDDYELYNGACVKKCDSCQVRNSSGACVAVTNTKACCEAAGRAWSGSICCASGQAVSNGQCCPAGSTYYEGVGCCASENASASCCSAIKGSTYEFWSGKQCLKKCDTCESRNSSGACETVTNTQSCCTAAGRLWSGSACCETGQVVVSGACQGKASCGSCQDYSSSTNTCTAHVRTEACCTAAGRLWSGSTCCTAGQVVVNGQCQDKATCTSCQDYNSATNTCTDHVRTSTCCAAQGRAWNGTSCCASGEVASNGQCCPAGSTYYDGVGCCASENASASCCSAIKGSTYEFWSGSQCLKKCDTCETRNSSGSCVTVTNTQTCCTAAGRLWSGSACCESGQVVVDGACQGKASCNSCQDYSSITNTCSAHVRTEACCTSAGRLWSGSTCCAAGQVVVNGQCQDKATCTSCQDYNSSTNTCTDHVKTSACCTAAGRLWSGSTCCAAGQVVVNGQCQDKATCTSCQDYNSSTNTCTDHVKTSACCTAAGRLWSGSTCCTAGQVVVNGQCQDKATCTSCQDYNSSTNTCTDHVRTSACCTAAGRLWSGSTCCTAGQVVVNGQCQNKATCTSCQDYNSATNTCTDHVKTSACCTAAGRLWSGSTCCTAGQVVVNGQCQNKATCTSCQDYNSATNTCTDHVKTSACCTAAGRLWSGSTCCTAGQVVVNGQCQNKATCTSCQDYNSTTNTCTDHVKTSACCTAAGRLWSGSTCCTAGQVVVNGQCQNKATCTSCQDYNSTTNTCTDHVKTSACCTAAGRKWNGTSCCEAGQVASNGQCCPSGSTYYAGVGCCASANASAACCTAINGSSYEWAVGSCRVKCDSCHTRNATTGACDFNNTIESCCTAANLFFGTAYGSTNNRCCTASESYSTLTTGVNGIGVCCPSKGQEYYASSDACCTSIQDSEKCCYGIHLYNPFYTDYTLSTINQVLRYDPNATGTTATTAKCQCIYGAGYDPDTFTQVKDDSSKYNDAMRCCRSNETWTQFYGMCCDSIAKSEECCYSMHLTKGTANFHEIYTEENIKDYVVYDKNATYQCSCRNGYASTDKRCCGLQEHLDSSTGKCVLCPAQQIWDASQNACVCPSVKDSDGNTVQLTFKDGQCVCPSAGYSLINGVCSKIDCRGGTTGATYKCYINDQMCGYNCNADGTNCSYGVCKHELCDTSYPFTRLTKPINGYYYGCKFPYSDNVTCYKYTAVLNGGYTCVTNSPFQRCMTLKSDFTTLESGVCEQSTCTAIQSGATLVFGQNTNGMCQFSDGLVCERTSATTWRCFKHGYQCGTNCTNPLSCGQCSTQDCFTGMTYNSSTDRCETSDYSCTTTLSSLQNCYKKSDGSMCAYMSTSAKHFMAGECVDPNCPTGMKFGKVNSSYWGCIDQTLGTKGLSCIYNNMGSGPYSCYYNGSTCGELCSDYTGLSCKRVYLPQCAEAGKCPQTGYDMSGGCTCDGQVTTLSGVSYCCPAGHTYTNGACAM